MVDKKKKTTMKLKSVVGTMTFLSLLLVNGCSPEKSIDAAKVERADVAGEENSIINHALVEDKRLYERDVDDSVKAVYITVFPDKHPDEKTVDWYGLNRLNNRYTTASLKIAMSEGEEDGLGPRSGMFGAVTQESNAKISLRGNSARTDAQKSYKIKLFDTAGVWNDQRVLNLNKHTGDFSRIRNKLSFDLMERIENLTSLRTQFVHLYVNDKTIPNSTDVYEDYGLYTHIEQPNKKFLKSHLLDPNGYLYKVTFFEFGLYPDEIKVIEDPEYDKVKFESILEVKGREDHEKLIAMLDDVNNTTIPINEVMEKHFDLDNFLTWTATNILMDNMDTDANNFYLYSPLNSEKWYILPWDYDGGWELQRKMNEIRPHQAGISNFWGSVLHNRYFQTEKHVDQLTAKLEDLQKIINAEEITRLVNSYKPETEPFIIRNPDIRFLPEKAGTYSAELDQLAEVPERAMERYYDDLEKPKPFYMGNPDVGESEITFNWDASFDLQKNELTYDVEVSEDPLFSKVIHTESGLATNTFTMKRPPDGFYYWRVTVTDEEGNVQNAFDAYIDEEDTYYYGALRMEVK